MITRRKFIATSAAAAAASMFKTDLFPGNDERKLKDFGFISGIIGKELKGDWKSVLRQVASFGFTEIETGNYLGDSPGSFMNFMNEINLKPVAGGFKLNATDEELKKSFALFNELGIRIAVVYWPWVTAAPFSLDACKRSAERLNQLGKICHDNGFSFCWHNHDKEFIPMESGLPFDYLMENTDSSLVKCEMDIYWVAKGGGDPLSLMKKYKGRYSILHVKDMAPGEAKDFECPGAGIIDFRPIFREAFDQGIKHFLVERDNAADGIECLRVSGNYLRNVTF